MPILKKMFEYLDIIALHFLACVHNYLITKHIIRKITLQQSSHFKIENIVVFITMEISSV